MEESKKKKFNHFDYNKIISIVFFGSIEVLYRIYDFRKEEWEPPSFPLSDLIYQYSLFISNKDVEVNTSGWEAKYRKRYGTFYVDKLVDKVDYLFAIEPNIKKQLKQARDRLCQRAIVQYFRNLINKIIDNNDMVRSKCRYLITYPSHWTLEQAAYLRSLLQLACIVDEHDHPDRLIMYNEGEAILRYFQSEQCIPIREGQKYMICNLSESKVEMHLYNIKGPIYPGNVIKSASWCNWYNDCIKSPAKMYIDERDFYPEIVLYLSSLLSIPSISIASEDLEKVLNKDVNSIADWWEINEVECLRKDEVENNSCISCDIPQSLDNLYCEKLNNMKESTTVPRWISDEPINRHSGENEEKLLKPVCNRITQYIKRIIETASDTIDDVILVSSKKHAYLIKLIADEYKKTTKKKVYKVKSLGIAKGAVLKYIDNLTAFDVYKPKIMYNNLNLSAEPGITSCKNIIILIDYGLKKTRVSYIHTQPGQIASDASINHIINWPGQTTFNRDFPTLNVMLIPKNSTNSVTGSKIDLWWKRGLYSNFLSGDCKAMFILQEDNDYKQKNSILANMIFYTFEKDEYGIILVTHQRKIVEELLIDTSYEVTRKRISFQEFSLLHFQYLAEFLHTYIFSKTGMKKDKYRYCITYDNRGYPEKLTLSNKDIYQNAVESNLISADILVLEHAEASAIYCRKLIDTTIAKEEAYLYFLQVQLHPDRCLLILNSVPRLDCEDNNSYREDGKPWECVHKYAETENISINFRNIISEDLWIHMQKIESFLLEKCEQHSAQKRYFNSKNMQIFKSMLNDYISTTNDLNLKDSEKEHTIRMCDNNPGSCCYLNISSMDLLEFAFNPVIDQLVSIIQSSIFKRDLFLGKQISDIFVMGEFLNCRDHTSYKFLEELLLPKLRNIHFSSFDNIVLQSMIKKTQIRKLNGREYQQGKDSSMEDRHNSLAQISSSGSIMFSIDPRNLLVERLAARTYIVKITPEPSTKIVYNQPGRNLHDKNSYHIIILKGTPLKSLSLIEDTIRKKFMITEYGENKLFLDINLLFGEDDNVSYLTNTNMDEDSWKDKFESSDFEHSKGIPILRSKFDNHSYPFSFNFCLSQTEIYTFWVEHGINGRLRREYIRESILLKSCHYE